MCFDDAMNTLVDVTIDAPEQQVVLLPASGRNDLGNVVLCEISEVTAEGSNRLQELNITTAVLGDLYLQDRYGSFVVESCEEQRCLEPVEYRYSITNIQEVPQTITELRRDRDGDSVSLLSIIPQSERMQLPGESTIVTEGSSINLCFDATIDTNVVVTAEPDEGGPACEGSDDYSVTVEVECRIDVDIKCETEAGVDCDALNAASESCTADESGLSTLRLKYESNSCEVATNGQGDLATCRDFTMPFDRVQLDCFDGSSDVASVMLDTTITSGEADVGEGETIVLSNLENINSVGCEIRSSLDSSMLYQIVTFDTSGTASLSLQDQFGSLQVDACGTATSSLDCLTTVCFEYVVRNVGTNDVNVADLSRTFKGETVSVLDLLSETMLASGESAVAIEKVLIDKCQDTEECVASNVQAAGSNGLVCEDTDEFCLGSDTPITQSPTATGPIPGIPSAAPTQAPVETPLPETPTTSPTTDMTMPETPTVSPTAVLTMPETPPVSPTAAPSMDMPMPEMPTLSPTLPPVETPISVAPTLSPTAAPLPLPVTPTTSPTAAGIMPTAAPTVSPSAEAPTSSTTAPTGACVIEVETECTPPPGSESCEAIRADPIQCIDRPEAMLFLFRGGNCENSFNAQSEPLFECEDFNGGPPAEVQSSSFVVITDIRGVGTVYYNNWVEVGDLIAVSPPEDVAVFEANQNVTIYSSNITGPDSILQTMVLHTSCSDDLSAQPLFLKDRFGSMQVVGFNNQAQGPLSCFVEVGIEARISVPDSESGQPVTVSNLQTSVIVTPAGDDSMFNFTEVVGSELTSDSDPVSVNLTVALDLTERKTYNMFTTVTGITEDGRECQGSDLFQFAAGQPPPPLFPTISPTVMPSISQQPTPDPEFAICSITAILDCFVIRGGSNSCVGLQNPSDVTCIGGMSPSSLSFQYTGDRCPVNPQNYICTDTELNTGAILTAFVEVSDGDRIINSTVVRLNEFLTVPGNFGPSTTMTLSTVENGMKGELLQTFEFPTTCNSEDDLTLLNQYGAFELTGFTNAASGEQGIEAQIELVYGVENSGFQSAEITSALVVDAFDGGPFDLVQVPFIMEPSQVSILFRNEQILNLRLKEQLGRTDTFSITVRGTSVFNDEECRDTAQLSF